MSGGFAIPSKKEFLEQWKVEGSTRKMPVLNPTTEKIFAEMGVTSLNKTWTVRLNAHKLETIVDEAAKRTPSHKKAIALRFLIAAALLAGAIASSIFLGPLSIPLYLPYVALSLYEFGKLGGFKNFHHWTDIILSLGGAILFPIVDLIPMVNTDPKNFTKQQKKEMQEVQKLAKAFDADSGKLSDKLKSEITLMDNIRVESPSFKRYVKERIEAYQQALKDLDKCNTYYSQFKKEAA